MKAIKLIHYTTPVLRSVRTADKFYYVSLGNGYKCKFSNEIDTKAFLSETSRDLNKKMYELNFLYSDILRLYRSSWLHFDKSKIQGLNNIEYLCTASFQGIEKNFNLIVDRCQSENGNYFVFNQFNYIIDEIKTVCDLLSQIFKNRRLTSHQYECDTFVLRAEYIATSLEIYPNKIKFSIEYLKQNELKKVI